MKLVNQDPFNHLNCRIGHTLAAVAGMSPWSELLMYCSLEPTLSIFRHCFIEGGHRWSYVPAYISDDDVRLLGFDLEFVDKASVDDVWEALPDLLAAGRIVMFDAPRAYFTHWVEFMRDNNTPKDFHFDPHSFLAAELTSDGSELVVMDNANIQHEYAAYRIPWAAVSRGYQELPGQWFRNCLIISHGGDEPQFAALAGRYRSFIGSLDDDLELYDVVQERLPSERDHFLVPHLAPCDSAIGLLAGSRGFFSRFLGYTNHTSRTQEAYRWLAKELSQVYTYAYNYYWRADGADVRPIQDRLRLIKGFERRALDLIREDLTRLDEIFAVPCRPEP